MNPAVSVVIICHNESHIIARTIAAAQQVSDDVVVVDSGSTDGTQHIVTSSGARLIETGWEGYGINKNKGVAAARKDWILSIDADEIPDAALIQALNALSFTNTTTVYNIRFRAFLGDAMIRFGEWSNDQHIRLYNRTRVSWNEAAVHEGLIFAADTKTTTIPGYIHHYTSRNIYDFAAKTVNYAMLNAEKYHRQGKKASWLQCRVAPAFSFVKNYLFRLGFLDGEAGFTVARMNAWYTWLKYVRLRELNKTSGA
jgi:glycosyltransferase involved in cell wall biosynthesis